MGIVEQPHETFIEFKELALRMIKDLFFVNPTEEQLKEAYEVFLGQPEEDPSGDRVLWCEHSLRSIDLKQMDTIKYNETKYPKRTFLVDLNDEGEREITISIDSLFEAFDGKYDLFDTEERRIDNTIYFYVEDEVIKGSAKFICENCLDEPMKFIEEN